MWVRARSVGAGHETHASVGGHGRGSSLGETTDAHNPTEARRARAEVVGTTICSERVAAHFSFSFSCRPNIRASISALLIVEDMLRAVVVCSGSGTSDVLLSVGARRLKTKMA